MKHHIQFSFLPVSHKREIGDFFYFSIFLSFGLLILVFKRMQRDSHLFFYLFLNIEKYNPLYIVISLNPVTHARRPNERYTHTHTHAHAQGTPHSICRFFMLLRLLRLLLLLLVDFVRLLGFMCQQFHPTDRRKIPSAQHDICLPF
jgi:hypothetical protein